MEGIYYCIGKYIFLYNGVARDGTSVEGNQGFPNEKNALQMPFLLYNIINDNYVKKKDKFKVYIL